MKVLIKSFLAIFKGFQYCLFNKKIRRLAFWPWLIGGVVYCISILGVWYAHSPLLSYFSSDPSGIWQHIVHVFFWLLTTAILFGASLLFTVIIVVALTGVFQTAIATEVLRMHNCEVPQERTGIKGSLAEVGRTVVVETAKLFWLLPLLVLAFVIGLIPFLTPFALILGAWLIAFQFIDIVLDVFRVKTRRRFGFAVKNFLLSIGFGIGLIVCGAVPFLGLFLPPIASAAAAWLLNELGLLEGLVE